MAVYDPFWTCVSDLKDAYCHNQFIGGTGSSFGLLLEERLTSTRFFPLAWPWHWGRSQSAWMLLWPLWGSMAFVYSTIWTISSYWSYYRDIVLHHIPVLGLRTNNKKSVLTPSWQTVFLGFHLDSVQMQARLAPARISSFNARLARFKLGHHISVSTCRRLLGLMATDSSVLHLGEGLSFGGWDCWGSAPQD